MRTVRRQSSPVSTSHRTIADGSVVSLMLCSMRSRIGHVALLIVFAYSCMRTVHGQLVSTAAETFGRQDVDGQSRWIRADTLLRWSKPCAPQTNSPRLSAGRWVIDTFGRPQGEGELNRSSTGRIAVCIGAAEHRQTPSGTAAPSADTMITLAISVLMPTLSTLGGGAGVWPIWIGFVCSLALSFVLLASVSRIGCAAQQRRFLSDVSTKGCAR